MATDRGSDKASTAEALRQLLTHRTTTTSSPDDAPEAAPIEPNADRELEAVIGDCGLYVKGERRSGRLPLSEARDAARGPDAFVWIGLQQPTADELTDVAREFSLPPLAVEDAIKAHQRPKLERYGDVLFVVLKPVHYLDHEEVVEVSEIAMFLGPGFAVTVRHGNSDVLRQVRDEFDGGNTDAASFGIAGLLYRTVDLVVDGYEEALRHIDEDVDEIELQVFQADLIDNSERIYKLKREIAEFRRAVLPLSPVVQRLASGEIEGVAGEAEPYFRDVYDHLLRTADGIEGHDRLLSDVLQADLSRVAAHQSHIAVQQNEIAMRQNADMRKISAWAAIALVPTAIAGIYGMNFRNMPELEWQYGYFIVVGTIGTLCVGLYALFKRNGWL